MTTSAPGYRVDLDFQLDSGDRNRLTVAFRIILAIPHLILVGGPGAFAFGFTFGIWNEDEVSLGVGSSGVLGAVAGVCAVIAWFAILFASKHPRGLWDFGNTYMRWWTRSSAYVAPSGRIPAIWRQRNLPGIVSDGLPGR